MMKILKGIIIVFFVLMLLIAGTIFLFVKNFDFNKYKDQLAQQVGDKLKTDVEIGNIDFEFDFKNGFAVKVEDVSFADKGLLSGLNVDIEEIQLAVDFKKLIQKRELLIKEIRFREPIIRIDLTKRMKEDDDFENNFSKNSVKSSVDEVKEDLLKLSIQDLKIIDGEIILIADENHFSKDFEIKDIDITVRDLVLMRGVDSPESQELDPFSFVLSFSAFDAKKALSVHGTGRLDVRNQQVRFDDVEMKSDLSALSVGMLVETFPVLKELGLRDLKGNVDAVISQIIFGLNGIPVLSARGSLTQGLINSEKIPVPIVDINIFSEFSNNNVDIFDSSFTFADGLVGFKGRIEDVLKMQVYNIDVKMSNVDVSKLVPKLPEGIETEGLLSGTALLHGADFDVPEAIRNLKGEFGFFITQGKLKNFNLLNYILQKISIIPNLENRLKQSLPEEYRQKMSVNETVFEDVGLNMSLKKGTVTYTADLVSDIAELDARGTVNWKKELLFNGRFILPKLLTEYLVEEVEEFSSLVDDKAGKIIIPLKEYSGSIEGFRPFPDMEYLAKNVLVLKAKEELRNLLGNLIGVEVQGGSDPESGKSQDQQDSAPDIVDAIFDSIFN